MLLHYVEEYKTGELFCPPPPSEITGGAVKSLGGKTTPPPGLMFLKYCNNVFGAQNMPMYFRLHCLYI